MALVIENGTGVAGAESYATVDQFRDYASKRDMDVSTLVGEDAKIEALLRNAADYLQAQDYRGTVSFPPDTATAFPGQGLAWPRTDYWVDTDDLATVLLPPAIVQAQIVTALEIFAGNDPMATTAPGDALPLIQETIGPITNKYASPATGEVLTPILRRVDALLAPWLSYGANGFRLLRV